ncbi:MAG: DUF3592 domain-containing protein [Vicinamibacterales bacterium]
MATPGAILAVAAVLCATAAWTYRRLLPQLRARHWQRAQARVHEAWLDEVGAVTAGAWRVGVRYTFTAADGREYRGDRVAFDGATHRERAAAEARLAPLRPGRSIEIWYDPADPTQSVIDRQVKLPRAIEAALGPLGVLGP